MTEVIFFGRGGQGAFTAARLLGLAASIHSGKHALSFPSFGPERRGAPVFGYTKIDDAPVTDRSETLLADYCIVLDESLLSGGALPLKDGGTLIVNSSKPDAYSSKSVRTVSLDAARLSLEILGKPIVNTALLGAFAAVSNTVSYNAYIHAIEDEMKKHAEKNITLFAVSYASVLSGAMI